MDLVQWIYETGGRFESALAPAGAPRLGLASSGNRPPRSLQQGGSLESVHLPFPLILGVEDPAASESAAAPAALRVRLVLSGGEAHARDPVSTEDEPHLIVGRLAEFCEVIADLLEAADLPLSNLVPRPKTLSLEAVLAPLERRLAVDVTHALMLLRAALELAADARGFALARGVVVWSDGSELPIDHRLSRYFLELTQ
jgi:hypothetical protein